MSVLQLRTMYAAGCALGLAACVIGHVALFVSDVSRFEEQYNMLFLIAALMSLPGSRATANAASLMGHVRTWPRMAAGAYALALALIYFANVNFGWSPGFSVATDWSCAAFVTTSAGALIFFAKFDGAMRQLRLGGVPTAIA